MRTALDPGEVIRAILYEVEDFDPAVLVGALLFLSGVALAAGYLPARRASRVDPMVAPRNE